MVRGLSMRVRVLDDEWWVVSTGVSGRGASQGLTGTVRSR